MHAGGQEFEPPHLHQRVRSERKDNRPSVKGNGLIAQVVRAHA